MRVLSVDVHGSRVKALLEGEDLGAARRAPAGAELGPTELVRVVGELVAREDFDRVSLGLPADVRAGKLVDEPRRLASGWRGFDFEAAFRRPVRIVNDEAMEALGSYRGGGMLFLRLGSELGSVLVRDGSLARLELGSLPYRKGRSFGDHLGAEGLARAGKREWRELAVDAAQRLRRALAADYAVLGGPHARKLGELPAELHRGDSRLAFLGGFRLWQSS